MANGQYIDMPPGGAGLPWNAQPPNNSGGGQPVTPINPGAYIPGQLPGEGAGPGDTQIGYPEAPAAPIVPTYAFAAGTPLVVRYIESGAATNAANDAFGTPPLRIYLGANAAGPTVASSLRFVFRGRTYVDRNGALYYGIDPLTNAGTLGGAYDYAQNTATLTDYAASGGNTVTIVSMATRYAEIGVSGVMFRTPGAPLREGSFTLRATTMSGEQLIADVDINGNISGDRIKGKIDWRSGLARVAFGALVTAAGHEAEPWYNPDLIDGDGKLWQPVEVDPGSVVFGTVIYRSIPVDPMLIGIDPVRLPNDGRVVGYNPGTLAVVSHTQLTVVAAPVAGATLDLGRDRIGFIEILDAAKKPVESVWYTLDLDAGTLTWSNPLNLSGYTLPITIRDRIQDVALIADIEITGQITLATPVTHNYPTGTIVSNALLWTDVQSRVTNVFSQQTYQAGVWSDERVGNPTSAAYNTVVYPIEVSNESAIDERWALVFRTTSTVDVIGETWGQVLTGVSIAEDIAPVNPITVTAENPAGKPFFTIRKEGWGGGWASGNVLRHNTISATRAPWLARVVTPGEITVANDAVRANVYGNAH